MLTVNEVAKQFGKGFALQPLTFSVEPGEVLAIVGSNGAGKTTLLKCILGLIRFAGEIRVGGVDVARNGKDARAKIGYLAQNPAFHGDMTVSETAVFYSHLRGVPESAAREGIEAVGLLEHADKHVAALSGGMRQRLGIAIVQLGDPSLLILDEPATGLDVDAREELRDVIRESRAQGKTVLLSTHRVEDVHEVADRVLMLKDGQLEYLGDSLAFVEQLRERGRERAAVKPNDAAAIPAAAAMRSRDPATNRANILSFEAASAACSAGHEPGRKTGGVR